MLELKLQTSNSNLNHFGIYRFEYLGFVWENIVYGQEQPIYENLRVLLLWYMYLKSFLRVSENLIGIGRPIAGFLKQVFSLIIFLEL